MSGELAGFWMSCEGFGRRPAVPPHKNSALPEANKPGLGIREEPSDGELGKVNRGSLWKLREM